MSAWIDAQRLAAVANSDGEFSLQARLWNARVSIANGVDLIELTVVQGRIVSAEEGAGRAEAADVHIAGSTAGWNEMLRPIPRPFYHDLRAAAVHHDFTLAGDLMHTAAYYPAIRRLIELLREVRNATL